HTDVELDVYVTRTSANQAGLYSLTISARALDDESIENARIKRDIIIGAFTDSPRIEINQIRSYFRSARYLVQITNPTNTIVSYRLSATEDRGDLNCTFHLSDDSRAAFAQNNLVVQPGATAHIHMHIQIKQGRSVGRQGRVVWLEVK